MTAKRRHPTVVRPGDPEPPVGTVLALKRLQFERCYDGKGGWCRSSAPEEWITWSTVCRYITAAFARGHIPVAAASVVKWGTA